MTLSLSIAVHQFLVPLCRVLFLQKHQLLPLAKQEICRCHVVHPPSVLSLVVRVLLSRDWRQLLVVLPFVGEGLQLSQEVPLWNDAHVLDLADHSVVYDKLRLDVLHGKRLRIDLLQQTAWLDSCRLLLGAGLGCRDGRGTFRGGLNFLLSSDGSKFITSALDLLCAIVAQIDGLLVLPLAGPLLVRFVELLLRFLIVTAEHRFSEAFLQRVFALLLVR